MGASVSVIVRVRDEAVALDRSLGLIRPQLTGPADELIVVDNDSRDGSAAVGRAHGARVLSISRAQFSFGRALNLGASVAGGEILVALSAHAEVTDPGWLNRLTAWFDDPTVAAVSGERFWPDGSRLLQPVRITPQIQAGYPRWGFSNAAGAIRADLWRRRPFREDLPGAEDKEWARHWLAAEGRVTVLDPRLTVAHDHTHDPVPSIFARARREARGFTAFLPAEALAPSVSLGEEWFFDTRFYDARWRARLSHRRLARLLGERAGLRGPGDRRAQS